MDQFLETLKCRVVEAQKRHLEAQQNLQKAQAEFQSAGQELNSWQIAVAAETRKQQATEQAPVSAQSEPPSLLPNANVQSPDSNVATTNKTEIVRGLLRQHPTGMTAIELWKQAIGQISHRPYLYSILKRLRDKGEVAVRRGKYMLRMTPTAQEGNNPANVIQ